jgi:hypothetical protein
MDLLQDRFKFSAEQQRKLLQDSIKQLYQAGYPFRSDFGFESEEHPTFKVLHELGIDQDTFQRAAIVCDFDVEQTINYLQNERARQIQSGGVTADLKVHLQSSTHGDLHPLSAIENGPITCLFPSCQRSRLFNGFHHSGLQERHMQHVHGWRPSQSVLRGLKITAELNVRDKTGVVLARLHAVLGERDPQSLVGYKLSASGVIRITYGDEMAVVILESDGLKRQRSAMQASVTPDLEHDQTRQLLQYLVQSLLKTGFPLDDRIYESGRLQIDVLQDLESLGFDRRWLKSTVEDNDFKVNETGIQLLDSKRYRASVAKDIYGRLTQGNSDFLKSQAKKGGDLHLNGEITCTHQSCERAMPWNGFYHLSTQQQHLIRVHGWDRNYDILRGLIVDPDGKVIDATGTVLAQTSELFDKVDGFEGGQIDESGLVVDAEGMRVCMVHLTDEGVKRQQSFLDENSIETGAKESSQDETANDEPEEQEQRMYMHYTISRDMTGSNDEVAAKLLAALGERSRETRFKDLEEPKDDIAAKLLPALGGGGMESRFKNADLTLLGSKGRLR